MLDFSSNLESFESSNLDFADDLKNKHKVEMIDVNKLHLNPLNPQFDTDEDVKELADKIYHNPKGIIDTLACYRNEDGEYTLLSGHKRLKAVRYNIEHSDELDGTGHIQKNVNCIVVPKPESELEEQQLIIDYNGYRKFETEEQKKALFLQGYQLYALKKLSGNFKGRAREEIARSTGLGKMKVGEYKKDLEDMVFNCAVKYRDKCNDEEIRPDEPLKDISKKLKLPLESVTVAFKTLQKQLNEGIRKEYSTDKKEQLTQEQIDRNNYIEKVRLKATENLDCKIKMSLKNDSFTIKINAPAEQYEEIIEKLGLNNG